jgi:hypothetical protein
VPGDLKHGWRKLSGAPVSMLCVTTMRLGRFHDEFGRPLAKVAQVRPKPAEIQRLIELVYTYGY